MKLTKGDVEAALSSLAAELKKSNGEAGEDKAKITPQPAPNADTAIQVVKADEPEEKPKDEKPAGDEVAAAPAEGQQDFVKSFETKSSKILAAKDFLKNLGIPEDSQQFRKAMHDIFGTTPDESIIDRLRSDESLVKSLDASPFLESLTVALSEQFERLTKAVSENQEETVSRDETLRKGLNDIGTVLLGFRKELQVLQKSVSDVQSTFALLKGMPVSGGKAVRVESGATILKKGSADTQLPVEERPSKEVVLSRMEHLARKGLIDNQQIIRFESSGEITKSTMELVLNKAI